MMDKKILRLHDKWTTKRIKALEEDTLEKCINFLNLCLDRGIVLRVTSAYRSFTDQAAIYAQGRTKPGMIVSNAQPGRSWHNYGRAFDIVEIKDKKAKWHNDNWDLIGELGISCGLEWGGAWNSFPDRPHFQNRGGMSLNTAYKNSQLK